MIYYILLLLVVLFVCNSNGYWITERQPKADTTVSFNRETITTLGFCLVILVLVLFEGLRSSTVGTDTPGYCRRFERGIGWSINVTGGSTFESEPLFNIITLAARFVSPHYIALLMVVSTICAVTSIKSIKDVSVNFTVSTYSFVTLAFYLFGFAAMRQGLALCIFMLSFKYVIERNLWKFLIVVLAGSLIHKTLLITIPIYFLGYLKFTKKSFALIVTCALIIASLLPKILAYTSTLDERYKYYTLETPESSGALLTLFAGFLFVFFLLYRKTINVNRLRFYDIYLYMLLISVCIYVVVWLTGSNVEINRIAMYFQIAAVFAVAEYYNANRDNGFSLSTLIIMTAQLGYYLVYVSKIGGISEYMLNPNL